MHAFVGCRPDPMILLIRIHQDADVRKFRVSLSTAKDADESQLVQGYT